MKSHVKTNVYWFTESSPNIHVQPSNGRIRIRALVSELEIRLINGQWGFRK